MLTIFLAACRSQNCPWILSRHSSWVRKDLRESSPPSSEVGSGEVRWANFRKRYCQLYCPSEVLKSWKGHLTLVTQSSLPAKCKISRWLLYWRLQRGLIDWPLGFVYRIIWPLLWIQFFACNCGTGFFPMKVLLCCRLLQAGGSLIMN